MAHDWPGNVRELENVIEYSFIICGNGYIEMMHLPEDLTATSMVSGDGKGIKTAHELVDTRAILAALERNGNNRTAAAKELGIHKTTLFRKIKKLGIFPLI